MLARSGGHPRTLGANPIACYCERSWAGYEYSACFQRTRVTADEAIYWPELMDRPVDVYKKIKSIEHLFLKTLPDAERTCEQGEKAIPPGSCLPKSAQSSRYRGK